MFISYKDSCVRLTGRFYEENNAANTTACGSCIEMAVWGDWAVLYFCMKDLIPSYPHIYIQVDEGEMIESAVSERLFIRMKEKKEHKITVIFKSAVEFQTRWKNNVQAKIAFEGVEAENAGILMPDNRKTITFIGDSITEGVLIYPKQSPNGDKNYDRVFQDDVTRTYAWQVAKSCNLRPTFCGYGAVGLTKGGSGGVPKVLESYPYCVDGVACDVGNPDYIMINHGANDRAAHSDEYIRQYEMFLDMIYNMHPKTKVICLSPFVGAHHEAIEAFVLKYNEKNNKDVWFIDSTGWIEPEPLHPLVDGHEIVARKIIEELHAKEEFREDLGL